VGRGRAIPAEARTGPDPGVSPLKPECGLRTGGDFCGGAVFAVRPLTTNRENDIHNQIFNTLDEVMGTVETSLRHLHEAPEELRSMTAFPWIFEMAA